VSTFFARRRRGNYIPQIEAIDEHPGGHMVVDVEGGLTRVFEIHQSRAAAQSRRERPDGNG
jgi:hypothetical protein